MHHETPRKTPGTDPPASDTIERRRDETYSCYKRADRQTLTSPSDCVLCLMTITHARFLSDATHRPMMVLFKKKKFCRTIVLGDDGSRPFIIKMHSDVRHDPTIADEKPFPASLALATMTRDVTGCLAPKALMFRVMYGQLRSSTLRCLPSCRDVDENGR